jgi:TrmH family RNA methyltransferase
MWRPVFYRPAQHRRIRWVTTVSKSDRLRVVLVATRNPLNLGAAARAMSNFGFLHLRVVNPYQVAFRQARSAVGASSLLKHAEEYQTIADAVADCSLVVGTSAVRNRQVQHRLYPLQEGARLIRRQLHSRQVALLFGSEKVGLSNEALSHCHWLLRIPTREQHPSMNLGQAVAVCLYELARASKTTARPAEGKSASAQELERFTVDLLEALRTSGYLKGAGLTGDAKVRRLVRRLALQAEDADVWLGMLRQILWKLRSSDRITGEANLRR